MKVKIAVFSMLLLGLISSVFCSGEELTKEFKTSDGFTIYLPENWIEIPKDVLNAYCDAAAKTTTSGHGPSYNYSFQLSDAQGWFEYPYILIQVYRQGRPSEAELKSMKLIENLLGNGLEKAQKVMPSMLLSAQLGEAVYDSSSNILWIRTGSDVAGVGSINGLTALLLARKSPIQINAYAKTEDFKKYLPTFEAIARGVIIEERLKYKPGFFDSIPVVGGIDWGKVLAKTLAGALIGAILGLFIFLFNKKSKNK